MTKTDKSQSLAETLRRLRLANDALVDRAGAGKELAEELQEKRNRAGLEAGFESVSDTEGVGGSDLQDLGLEAVVLRTGRPVLQIFENEPKLEFRDSDSEVWRKRLTVAKPQIVQAVKAVGRIELANDPRFSWVGTGWLVRPTVIVTNRHVASLFARKDGEEFVFKSGLLGSVAASVDFLEEFGRDDSLEFKLKKVLHIEEDGGPDIALIEVDVTSNGATLATPIKLAQRGDADRFVATIGYPAKDSRMPDFQLMMDIFGDVFDKKRLAPGQVTKCTDVEVRHDCSTLGGNSGSVVMDLETGEALALHFAGRFLETNFAVPAGLVEQRVQQLKGGTRLVKTDEQLVSGLARGLAVSPATLQSPAAPVSSVKTEAPPVVTGAAAQASSGATLTCTIPVTFTIQVGNPVMAAAAVPAVASAAAVAPRALAARPAAEDDFVATEAPPESYANRMGFLRDFLGAGNAVELPTVRRGSKDLVTFELDGKKQSELKYQHFSVVMNRARRQCFFSACNVDGKQSKRTVRAGWKFDSRIPQNLQIMKECYGNAPKFSRGHMTRREDPAWGSREESNLGNEDSMHVTNTVPQMQSFNAGVWLSLEDYALQHAREDDMRISVITGPMFENDDPEMFGVKVPKQFWKVLAFVHDKTKKLTVTGYSISQEDFLKPDEFVFGEFQTYQRSLRWIEDQAGISFGDLKDHDPMDKDHEGVEGALEGLDAIRFV